MIKNIRLKNILEKSQCSEYYTYYFIYFIFNTNTHLLHLIIVFMKNKRVSPATRQSLSVCLTAQNGDKPLPRCLINTMFVPIKSLLPAVLSTVSNLVFLPSFILFYSI